MKKDCTRFREMNPQQKIRLIESICIPYPRFQKLVELIDYCREYSKIAAEPEGALITGPPGSGKSTLRRWYASKHRPRQTKTATVIPVLHLEVPAPATVKGLVTELLTALTDPFAQKGSIVNQTIRLKELIKKCLIETIIFDEFQHFIERDSKKVLHGISDWTKKLMNDTRKPIILLGTEKSHEILDAPGNEQLRRRFPHRESLADFGWTTDDEIREMRGFLKKLDEVLPFREYSNLADTDTAAVIHFATGGNLNSIMKLTRYAASVAVTNNASKIDFEHFRLAYEKKLAKNNPRRENPFKWFI